MPAINFKIEKQQHSDWCWAAVASSIDRYFNPKSRWCQCKLASEMAKVEKLKVRTCGNCKKHKATDEVCNQPWYLQKALKIVGCLKGQPLPGPLSFSKIRKTLEAGKPVCVMVEWGKGPEAHFVVITGCVKGAHGERWVDIEDPDMGSSTWLFEEFRSNYQYYKGHWNFTFMVEK